MAKTPYLIATYSKVPAEGQNTSVKGWGKKGIWKIHETIFFEDRLKTKYIQEAHVIINLLTLEVIKTRFTDDSEEENVN